MSNEELYEGTPEIIAEIDYDNYVYALCKCPLPTIYGIKIPKRPGKTSYPFKCSSCGCIGIVHTKGEQRWQ